MKSGCYEGLYGIALCLLAMPLLLLIEPKGFAAGVGNPSEFKGNGICQFALKDFVLAPQSEAVINQTVEKLLQQHQAVFGFRRQPEFRLRMRVYGRFEDFTNSTALKGLARLQGVYLSSRKEIITYQQELPGTLGTTLLHEASHAIMDGHYETVQPWLMEGAAEYFSFALARNAQNSSYLQKRWALLNAWLQKGQLPALERLVNANYKQWKALDPELAYCASWSLFQFLMSSETNKRMMKTMLLEWQSMSGSSIDCASQVQRLYPGGLTQLEKDWHRWIDKSGNANVAKASFRGAGVCRFMPVGCELNRSVETAANQKVENLISKLQAMLDFKRKPGFSLHIRLFGDFKEYARYSTNALVTGWDVKAAELIRIPGYYSPFSSEIVTWTQEHEDKLIHTIVYLASNALLKEHFPKLPRWISSGSSEFFLGSIQPATDEMARFRRAWERTATVARMPAIRSLLDDSSPVWQTRNSENTIQNEIGSWALLQFLCSQQGNQKVLKSLLKNVEATPGTVSNSAQQLERLYPGGLNKFEADFNRWLAHVLQE